MLLERPASRAATHNCGNVLAVCLLRTYVRTTYWLNEQATAAGSIESKCWLIFGDWGRRTYNAASMLCVFVFRRNPSVSHGISVNQDWIQPLRTFSPVKSTASTRFACVLVVFRGSRTFSVATLHTSAVFLSPTIRPYLKKSIHERSSGPLR